MPLERGEECPPGAIVQKIVQNGNGFEQRLSCSLGTIQLRLDFLSALKEDALFLLRPAEGGFAQASGKSDRQQASEVFGASADDKFQKKGQNLLRNILRFELSE